MQSVGSCWLLLGNGRQYTHNVLFLVSDIIIKTLNLQSHATDNISSECFKYGSTMKGIYLVYLLLAQVAYALLVVMITFHGFYNLG